MYTYFTDTNGRIARAEGQLAEKLKENPPAKGLASASDYAAQKQKADSAVFAELLTTIQKGTNTGSRA